MSGDSLSPLQRRILRVLAPITPPWTLTGGGALAGVHLKALLDAGGDLEAGLRDAPQKDGGFSPLTLAWVLKGHDVRPAAKALGWSVPQAEELHAFNRWLVDRLTAGAAPE